jgi:alpha-L-rhamnosidase
VPLVFGLVPAEHVSSVAANLAANVEAQGRHLDTGALGTGALPIALSDHGRADLAHAVLAQRSYPSYGHLRDLGATTLWESWDADSRGHNDPTLSLPMLWFVERVPGVEALQPGWARFRVAPRAFGPLPAASLSLDTVRGRIDVAWQRSAGTLTLDLRALAVFVLVIEAGAAALGEPVCAGDSGEHVLQLRAFGGGEGAGQLGLVSHGHSHDLRQCWPCR